MMNGGPVNTTTLAIESVHPPDQKLAANGIVGMLLFIATEVMFFAGLISAFIVTRAGVVWPPADQPRLPVEATAVNTLVLLASGLVLWWANRAFMEFDSDRTKKLLGIAIGLGTCFVAIQGYEWVRLLSFGLTVRSSTYGAFFYLIVGAHAVHAVAALVALGYCSFRLRDNDLPRTTFSATQLFWYFVVLLWPVLYILVYLL